MRIILPILIGLILTSCAKVEVKPGADGNLNDKIIKTAKETGVKSKAKPEKLIRILGSGDLNKAQKAQFELDTIPVDEIEKTIIRMLDAEESDYAMAETIVYFRDRAPESIKNLLPAVLKNSSPRVISTMFALLPLTESKLSSDEVKKVAEYLEHKDIIVRLHAGRLLRGKGYDKRILGVAAGLLNSEKPGYYYDDLTAGAHAKDLISGWQPRETAMQFIREYMPADESTKYNLIDAYAVLAGKIDVYIYNPSVPTTKEKLDKLASEVNLKFAK